MCTTTGWWPSRWALSGKRPTPRPSIWPRPRRWNSPDDLCRHRILLNSHHVYGREWRLEKDGELKSITTRPMLVCDQYASLISGLIAGHGVALLPHYVASHYLESGHLVRVLPGWQGGSWPVYLVFPYRQPLPKNTKPSSSMSPRACAPCWKSARCTPATEAAHLPRRLIQTKASSAGLCTIARNTATRIRRMRRMRAVMEHLDILIVGGGMVGSALASALSGKGLKLAVLEQTAPPRLTRHRHRTCAYRPSARHRPVAGRLGAWPRILAMRAAPYRRMQVWEDQEQNGTLFDAAEAGVDALGHIVENRIVQLATSAISARRALPALSTRPRHRASRWKTAPCW
jgi:hypothetical protein